MRILIISKRQYTRKDLIDDQFGRIFEIPAQLSLRGHDVRGVAISYRRKPEKIYSWIDYPGLSWVSTNAFPSGLFNFRRTFSQTLNDWRPDIIWASSDALVCFLAQLLSRRLQIPLAIDLYDNYESFGLTRTLGLTKKFQHVCRDAEVLTCVSHTLAERVNKLYKRTAPTVVLENAARTDLFKSRDKQLCRTLLGLPQNAVLIGTAGALQRNRGIADLFNAFSLLAARQADLYLVVAGPRDKSIQKFNHPRIIDLGVLEHSKVALLFSALDVGIICNQDSNFGRYCHPLKLVEFLAAGTPVVAADVGEASALLKSRPDCLYTPGDHRQLAKQIGAHVRSYNNNDLPLVSNWESIAQRLEAVLEEASSTAR